MGKWSRREEVEVFIFGLKTKTKNLIGKMEVVPFKWNSLRSSKYLCPTPRAPRIDPLIKPRTMHAIDMLVCKGWDSIPHRARITLRDFANERRPDPTQCDRADMRSAPRSTAGLDGPFVARVATRPDARMLHTLI